MRTKHSKRAKGLVKVVFELPKSDWYDYGTESMWASHLGHDRYRLENIPFYAYGVSYGDVIVAGQIQGQIVFRIVSHRGGHSTYRVFLYEGTTDEKFKRIWGELEQLGCTYEKATDRLFAIDVPPQANIYEAYGILERGETSQAWDFEEAHCGHPLGK